MNKKVLIGVFLFLIIGVGGLLFFIFTRKSFPQKNQTPTTQDESTVSISVIITPSGFSVNTITLRKGAQVELKNSSPSTVEIQAQDASFKISAGEVHTLKLEKMGQFTFTDKNTKQSLLIVVQ